MKAKQSVEEQIDYDHDKPLNHASWKPINSLFYLTLDRMWKERNNNKAWVKMYEQLKHDLLENKESYLWRVTSGEIEVKRFTRENIEERLERRTGGL